MRTALLPTGPDPYLLAYWLKNYRSWADHVDALHVIACGQSDPEMLAYMEARVASVPHASVTFFEDRTDHGVVLDALVKGAPDGLVLLCENDAFVRDPQVIGDCFARIESGEADLVGTPRGYSSYELIDRATELWGDMPRTEYGENGWALSPAFLFARRSDLMKVQLEGESASRYSSTRWHPRKRIKSLGMTVGKATMSADTFGAASFQLRAMGLRCETRPAYRSDHAFRGGPWFHVGSLSDGYGWAFLGREDSRRIMVAEARHDAHDWYKRCAWWWRTWNTSWDGPEKQHRAYGSALNRFIADAGISEYLIREAASSIDGLVTWAEK